MPHPDSRTARIEAGERVRKSKLRDGNRLPAVTYIAKGGDNDGKPSLRYLTLLREGAAAHGLPRHWLRFLDNVKNAE